MAIVTWTPKTHFTNVNDVVKALSMRHKNLSYDERLVVIVSYKDIVFNLTFRNYYKERTLKIEYTLNDVKVVVERDRKGYITGHEFIAFIKQFLKSIGN